MVFTMSRATNQIFCPRRAEYHSAKALQITIQIRRIMIPGFSAKNNLNEEFNVSGSMKQ